MRQDGVTNPAPATSYFRTKSLFGAQPGPPASHGRNQRPSRSAKHLCEEWIRVPTGTPAVEIDLHRNIMPAVASSGMHARHRRVMREASGTWSLFGMVPFARGSRDCRDIARPHHQRKSKSYVPASYLSDSRADQLDLHCAVGRDVCDRLRENVRALLVQQRCRMAGVRACS